MILQGKSKKIKIRQKTFKCLQTITDCRQCGQVVKSTELLGNVIEAYLRHSVVSMGKHLTAFFLFGGFYKQL